MQEIIIVDDHEGALSALEEKVERFGYTPNCFLDFLEAEKYIQGQESLSHAYFVDMKPVEFVPSNPSEEMSHLLQTPERIFRLVESMGGKDRFYFLTGLISNHDRTVASKLGVKCHDKTTFHMNLGEILQNK